jgi:hypothetical protein
VAMVADDRLGSSFHISVVRFQGTVFGSLIGYLIVKILVCPSRSSAPMLRCSRL